MPSAAATPVFPGRRVVFLDALGTLVQLEPPAPRLQRELKRRFDLSVSAAGAQRAIRAEMAFYRAHLDQGRDGPSLADLRRRCAEVLWRELPDSRWEPDSDALVEALMASLAFHPFEDAPGALAALKEGGLLVMVVSNWDVSLPEVLGRLGLAAHIDGVVTSAGVGARKPDRAIFEHALKLAGAGPGEAIHAGDSLSEDVEGAHAAGIDAVLLARSGAKHGVPGEAQIGSLRELPILLGVGAREC